MARSFFSQPNFNASVDLPVGGLDWVPGGIKKTGPELNFKRPALVTGVPPYTDERGMRDNQSNGLVHITKLVDMSGPLFTPQHVGLGELLFEFTSDADLPFGTQASRIVSYSELNNRLATQIAAYIATARQAAIADEYSIDGTLTAFKLYQYAMRCARQWKFIGVQPTEHKAMAQGRDSVHMAVAASHKCNAINVFLADRVVEETNLLFLRIVGPESEVATANVLEDHAGVEYAKVIENMCISPFVSSHRRTPPNLFYIYIGVASFLYGTHYDAREPYTRQTLAIEAISRRDREEQLGRLRVMPTIDIFLGR
jgi:hypothetical protein